jgi:hypothetical protein
VHITGWEKWLTAAILMAASVLAAYSQWPPVNSSLPGNSGQLLRNDSGVIGAVDAPSGLQSGMIIALLSGTCPSGFSEATALNGKTVIGTLAANGGVGTTGGSDTLTPAGTISTPTFTGAALSTHTHGAGTLSAAAQTFTGDALGTHSHGVGTYANGTTGSESSHTHSVTSNVSVANHSFTDPTIAWPAGVPTAATEASHTHGVGSYATSGDAATANTGSSGAARPTQTHTHSVTGTSAAGSAHTHTLSWPAGVPTNSSGAVDAHGVTNTAVTSGAGSAHSHSGPTLSGASAAVSAGTPSGTNASSAVSGTSAATSAGTPSGTVSQPTFTGTSAENRSAFVRVIFCQKD